MKTALYRMIRPGLVALSLITAGVIHAQDTFTPYAGTFQGLLKDTTTDAPVGRVDFTLTSKGALSSVITLSNQKAYRFSAKTTLDEINNWAEVENFNVVKPKTTPVPLSFSVNLYVKSDGTFDFTGAATLPGYSGSFSVDTTTAAKLRLYKAKTDECPWAGTYTLAFPDADNLGTKIPPGGVSIGSAVIKTDGLLTLKSTLADGTKITASTRPSQDGTYRFFVLVHRTAGSYFTTKFTLNQKLNGRFSDNGNGSARWSKAENSKDKAYPEGFQVEFRNIVNQWVPPGKGETIQSVLGMQDHEVLDIDFFAGLNTTTYAKFLPTQLGITAKNIFRVAGGLAGSPSPLYPEQWAKVFSGKIDPKTGLLTLTLNIEDQVTTGVPPRIKVITKKRRVTVNGIYHQLATNDLWVPYAYGHLLIPPLDPKTETLMSGGFNLPGPVQLDPFMVTAGATAGTYTTRLTELTPGTPPPSNLPPLSPASVTFSISSNLKEMVFHGRKIPLKGDSRPVSLVYTNADKSVRDNLTVTVYLNGAGVVSSLATQYFQVSGFTVKVRNHTSNSVTKQP